ACAGNARRPVASWPAAPTPDRSPPGSTPGLDRSRCKSRATARSFDSDSGETPARSSLAPHAPLKTEWTNSCGACITTRRNTALSAHRSEGPVGWIGKIAPPDLRPYLQSEQENSQENADPSSL